MSGQPADRNYGSSGQPGLHFFLSADCAASMIVFPAGRPGGHTVCLAARQAGQCGMSGRSVGRSCRVSGWVVGQHYRMSGLFA